MVLLSAYVVARLNTSVSDTITLQDFILVAEGTRIAIQ